MLNNRQDDSYIPYTRLLLGSRLAETSRSKRRCVGDSGPRNRTCMEVGKALNWDVSWVQPRSHNKFDTKQETDAVRRTGPRFQRNAHCSPLDPESLCTSSLRAKPAMLFRPQETSLWRCCQLPLPWRKLTHSPGGDGTKYHMNPAALARCSHLMAQYAGKREDPASRGRADGSCFSFILLL